MKSIDTRVTSQIRFALNGPKEGFRTCLRLKFWVRGRRRWLPRLDERLQAAGLGDFLPRPAEETMQKIADLLGQTLPEPGRDAT